MNYKNNPDKKMTIVEKTWEYLLTTGLLQASIGDLCRKEKLAQSSLYYWFENKEDIWISAGKYGLTKVIDKLFDFIIKHIEPVEDYSKNLLQEIDKYKPNLRCLIQLTVSPVYGKRMREAMNEFSNSYYYAEKLVKIYGCTYKQAEAFIYSVFSAIVYYTIWEDNEKLQSHLNNIQNTIKFHLTTEHNSENL